MIAGWISQEKTQDLGKTGTFYSAPSVANVSVSNRDKRNRFGNYKNKPTTR